MYLDLTSQLLDKLSKCVVNVHVDVVSGWDISFGGFGPHCHQAVLKHSFVNHTKRLIHTFDHHTSTNHTWQILTYLITTNNELSN